MDLIDETQVSYMQMIIISKTYLTWLLWSVEMTLTKKEICKLNSAEVIR